MYISWLGLNCFKIQTGTGALIIDPYGSKTGLKLPRLQADIVLTTQKNDYQFNNIEVVGGNPYIIDGPGEYELKKISIRGEIAQVNGQPIDKNFQTIYYIEAEDIAIGHLGAINHPLANKQLETFEAVDVLLVPVGGGQALTPEKAAEVISQLEPRIVIPMYYKTSGLKNNIGTLNKFLAHMGIKDPEELPKLKLQRKDLPQEETETIVLKP